MRRKFMVFATAGLILGLAACTSPGSEPLATLNSGGVDYELVTAPNQQGPDAPCVGVSYDSDGGGSYAHLACPTLTSEEAQHAAALGESAWALVVGYGLEPGEGIELGDAVAVITTESEGRHFFLIQLTQTSDMESYEILVRRQDGTTRSIGLAGN